MKAWTLTLCAALTSLVLAGCGGGPSSPTNSKRIALTYDDGPNEPVTGELLNVLAAAGAKATFFEVGKNVAAQPATARRILAEGHELGCHSYSHASLGQLSAPAWQSEISRGREAIRLATGFLPTLFRCPYWDAPAGIEDYCRANGLTLVGENIDSLDWKTPSPREIADLVIAKAKTRPGAIVCLHDGTDTKRNPSRMTTVAATRMILDDLGRQGYTFVTVSGLRS
jgi:peptidoglycan/xylan/chitin deacetylase (PgdA/CDA1 family)